MPTVAPTSLSTAATASTGSIQFARSPWVWWHLFSLDAPTIAVLWCWFFAAAFKIDFPWTTLLTLGLGTWCVYVADRLLDGWRSAGTITLRDRHWFYLRHRKPFIFAWIIAAIPLIYLILTKVRRSVRTDDIILCLIGVAYFSLIHGSQPHRSQPRVSRSHLRQRNESRHGNMHWFSKELAVGFLFAIATAVPTWAMLRGDRAILVSAIFIFGSVCWLNCVAIQVWEDTEASHEVTHTILSGISHSMAASQTRGMTQLLGKHLTGFAVAIGALSLCFAWATAKSSVWPLFTAVIFSAILFVTLIRNSQRFSTLSLRIAADAALLTPLLFIHCVR